MLSFLRKQESGLSRHRNPLTRLSRIRFALEPAFRQPGERRVCFIQAKGYVESNDRGKRPKRSWKEREVLGEYGGVAFSYGLA